MVPKGCYAEQMPGKVLEIRCDGKSVDYQGIKALEWASGECVVCKANRIQ